MPLPAVHDDWKGDARKDLEWVGVRTSGCLRNGEVLVYLDQLQKDDLVLLCNPLEPSMTSLSFLWEYLKLLSHDFEA